MNTENGAASFGVISDALQHDKFSVAAFNRAILASGPADIETLHIFTDGAASQFKNRFTPSTLTDPKLIYSKLKNVDWSFFGTAHGKGPVDGVGGTVKRAVWRRMLQRQVLLNTARDFANVAERACPNIKVIFIPKDHVEEVEKEFQEIWDKDEPKNIPNIRNARFFRRHSINALEKSIITPYFQEFQESIVFEKVVIFNKSTATNHQSMVCGCHLGHIRSGTYSS